MITRILIYFHFVNLLTELFLFLFFQAKFIENKGKKTGDKNLTQGKKKNSQIKKGFST